MTLAWGAKVSPEFRRRVLHMAPRLGVDPSWIMAIIAFETGRTFSPSVWNAVNHAYVGLIQFGEAAATDLGTTTEALAAMTAVEQLDYVERYFAHRIAQYGPLRTLASAYMAVLSPTAIPLPDDAVLFGAPSKAYVQNRGLDINNDGKITKAEAATFVARALAEGTQYATDERELRDVPPEAQQAATPEGRKPKMGALGLGLVEGLLGEVFKRFAPATREKVDAAADKVATPDSRNALVNTLMGVLQKVTGLEDPVQATAAITANTDAAKAKLAEAERITLATLDQVGAFIDRIDAYEGAAAKRTEDSRDRANVRASNAEGWKLRWAQLNATRQAMAAALVGVVGLTIVQMIVQKAGPSEGLIVLATALIMANVNTFRDIAGYLWGGVYHSTAAEEAGAELNERRNEGGTKA